MVCPDGAAHDKIFPDKIKFTCKPGPGSNVKCKEYGKYDN